MKPAQSPLLISSLIVSFILLSEQSKANQTELSANSRDAKDAVSQLDLNDPSLELTLFASEPMISNPSTIDVDAQGRVWVGEIVNYRHFRNGEFKTREEGDRILILEDTDHDGKADKTTVFYQGRDIDSPHGILVLGNRVLVSTPRTIMEFYDDNNDLKADRHSVLFSDGGKDQHDHGFHAVIFGPDGKLYFNFGNECRQLLDKNGKVVVDRSGRDVKSGSGPYQQGMIFRCDLNGSNVETIAWNFRNPWEPCLDAFGNIWQSDNDDDGNKATRINYVMEFGNYGFNDEITKEGWRANRTNLEEEIPRRHWHQNDPGVVPNMLITGAGSPCGMIYYAGDLLGEKYKGQMIHCDPGPNMVRVYHPQKDGSGYKATLEVLIEGKRDQWFRPDDVCTAPDGSLFISDWYDGGVGGHRMVDIDKGRIFRLAPKGHQYEPEAINVSTAKGAVKSLLSPNMATRYLGWEALIPMGDKAESALEAAVKATISKPQKAQLMWAIAMLEPVDAESELHQWKKDMISQLNPDNDLDLLVCNLKLARHLMSTYGFKEHSALLPPPSPELREQPELMREVCISIHQLTAYEMMPPDAASSILMRLSKNYTPGDRWLLEALGISLDGNWNNLLESYSEALDNASTPQERAEVLTPAVRELIWRSRGEKTPALLIAIIQEPSTPTSELPRYFRSMDFVDLSDIQEELASLAFTPSPGDPERDTIVMTESVKRLKNFDLAKHPKYHELVEKRLATVSDPNRWFSLVKMLNFAPALIHMHSQVAQQADSQLGVDMATYLWQHDSPTAIAQNISPKAKSSDPKATPDGIKALQSYAQTRSPKMILVTREILSLDGDEFDPIKREAIRAIGGFEGGRKQLMSWLQEGVIDERFNQTVAPLLHASNDSSVKSFANQQFPLPPSKDSKSLPPVTELAKQRGNVAAGKLLYHTTGTCGKCHIALGLGKEVGPNLSEIGSKLSRESMLESILYPSAGISHGFESYNIITTEGIQEVGLLVSETDDEVTLKNADGLLRKIPVSKIELKEKQEISLMPSDLQKLLTEKELVDLVEFLMTLKRQ